MWGTTPPCRKLTGDSGSGFEAALIGDCRLFRLSAENQPPGLLGVLQHYLPEDGVIGRTSLWIAEDFGVLRFRLMVKRGPW
jgi:hypothetical protein